MKNFKELLPLEEEMLEYLIASGHGMEQKKLEEGIATCFTKMVSLFQFDPMICQSYIKAKIDEEIYVNFDVYLDVMEEEGKTDFELLKEFADGCYSFLLKVTTKKS